MLRSQQLYYITVKSVTLLTYEGISNYFKLQESQHFYYNEDITTKLYTQFVQFYFNRFHIHNKKLKLESCKSKSTSQI